MKRFSLVALPHKDIKEGKLTLDIFAADLWEVYKGRAPEEYSNPDVFFRKTFITSGLKKLLEVSEKRLKGEGGDSIIQLQTPFGGGKTHSLIALYHKAKEWGVKTIVIDGTTLDPKERTLWEEMEFQLTGKVEMLQGRISPGREKLNKLFLKNQPLLILMDEILQYTTRASGVKVGDSNLASQVLAFIQELTGVVRTLGQSLLILTLPSSVLEHYDENTERLFQQLQKITGRIEKIYTPVKDEEISSIIRRRLFSSIDEDEAKKIIEEFLDYAEKENIFPKGIEKAVYREKFIKSYPFQPEVIDVLYKRWGSFPTFQRTRGVLRILGMVIKDLLNKPDIPFVRLGDFNLENTEIRRELIKHIGDEYDSIIAADITSRDSGAKRVDKSLGDAYISFNFGTKIATSIFMYSFSGGSERGATVNEIKLSTAVVDVPSSIISEAISKLKENLFYISDEGLYFTNQPNLNRILLTKMETIEDRDIEENERALLNKNLTKEHFDIFIWPKDSRDIPDTKKLKLVVVKNKKLCSEFLNNCGDKPRVYLNTLIFLCEKDIERISFEDSLKRYLAWKLIEKDKTLKLTEEQEKEVKERVNKSWRDVNQKLIDLYRIVFLPSRDGFEEIDLGMSVHGMGSTINKRVYERLREEEKIFERLNPYPIREKYLKERDFVETKSIFESFLKTPGEFRLVGEKVFIETIKEGVKSGLFGLGFLEEEKPVCKHFREEAYPDLVEGEIIIREELCKEGKILPESEFNEFIGKIKSTKSLAELEEIKEEISKKPLSEKQKVKINEVITKKGDELTNKENKESYRNLSMRLNIPSGKLSDVANIIRYLKEKFNRIDMKIEIYAKDGSLSKSEYEDKIKEAILQSGIKIEDEKKE